MKEMIIDKGVTFQENSIQLSLFLLPFYFFSDRNTTHKIITKRPVSTAVLRIHLSCIIIIILFLSLVAEIFSNGTFNSC